MNPRGPGWKPGCLLCAPGSSYDRQCGPDPSHADVEGGPEAHPRLPAPEVTSVTPVIVDVLEMHHSRVVLSGLSARA